jgi:hypothetical protein
MIIDSKEWKIINQEVRMSKGKLVNIQISPGRFVKMYEADAIAQGLIPGKARPQAPNKMLTPQANKAAGPAQIEEKAPADDFTTIPGIGLASARALVAHGITTFEQLREAVGITCLTSKARDAIETWRTNG